MKRQILLIVTALVILAAIPLGIWGHKQYQNREYLVIKEWGVGFKVSQELRRDIEYRILIGDDLADADFGSRRLAKIAPDCAADKIGINFRIERSKISQRPYDEYGYMSGDIKKIGKYYYALYMSGRYKESWCYKRTADPSDPVWAQAKAISEELYKAVRTMKAIE